MEIAGKNGKTLEMCMMEHREELEGAGVRFKENDDKTVSIDYGNTRDESKQFWDDCSKSFAEQSSGNVHVIEGKDLRPNGQTESEFPSTYNRIEHPALEQNQNVNSIIHIDPKSREQTAIETFSRNHSRSSSADAVSATNTRSTNGEQIAGTQPVETHAIQNNSNVVAGQKPPQTFPTSENTELQVAGTTPDKKQNLDVANNADAAVQAGKGLTDEASKNTSNAVSAGIT